MSRPELRRSGDGLRKKEGRKEGKWMRDEETETETAFNLPHSPAQSPQPRTAPPTTAHTPRPTSTHGHRPRPAQSPANVQGERTDRAGSPSSASPPSRHTFAQAACTVLYIHTACTLASTTYSTVHMGVASSEWGGGGGRHLRKTATCATWIFSASSSLPL